MTGGDLFREANKVICRGAYSSRNETDKTPETSSAQTQSDSQAENEYSGSEQAIRHSIHIPTQQTTQQSDGIWSIGNLGGISNGPFQAVEQRSSLKDELEENERKARVDAVWNQINQGLPVKMPRTSMSKSTPERKATTQKTPDWMVALGLVPKKTSAIQETPGKRPAAVHNCTSEEARKAAAAALSAVREVTSASASTGKVEIKEVRDFAGRDIEVKKLVDPNSREAVEKAKSATGAQPSALDAILDQIKKKQKLSVLDKTKMDWGEYKDERKGIEDELDAYKKSSNQYLDRVSFLQRTDLREFERERDARLAMQSKRKLADMREDNL